ncbi:isopeptide-forming domain-containing fimbrial protein [Faecalibacterium prausnitzii]|uniref:Isopeptide-forming domain-containing fimbrial protein n=1 Tax=Faecalibacterium prausnitzii TaxID=853 RepID=A0A2J4JLB7_9FIRM|nr:isopeptide-forming domain-containing fimbrial protein [Faecalibacterium prausnitzii]PLK28653.1 isopeptide-forming domain-containing fimbrial protein [Faecalibacterium prausnitzii]
MMKKAIKKLLAALLAVAMVCAMAIPAFAENSEGDVDSHHTYSAFQIFKGDVEGNNIKDFKISNVDWGSNIINNSDDFLNKLREADHIGPLFTNAKSAQEVLAVISQWHDSDDYSIAFARFVCHYLYSNDANPTYVVRAGSNALTIPEAKAGYYLFVDTTDFSKDDSYHSYNSFLLMVTKGNWNVPITPKAEKPTVEKKVYDNPDGTSTGGFGSSADHAINEKFQFQLTATLPDSTNRAYDYYDKYSVIFHDTLSEGITYDGPYSVVIKSNDITYTITDPSKYTINTDKLDSQNYFEVEIPDVKTCVAGLDLNKGATITVTYTAHLNEKASVNTAGGGTSNINKVYLTYSNNPQDESSIGKTPESTPVYVYTYQLSNTKRQNTVNGPALAGAGFKLYSDAECNNEVGLYQEGEFYYPIKDATGKKAVEMISGENGQFNVKGLDAGTYYLKETITPAGYDTCGVTPVTIKADHSGNDHVNLEGSNLTNDIVNIKAGGITLPSTGGIGTTLFYVVGGGLMVAAIVLLVTKKRMENK